ncbi:unnamed protein product, partial [marine sediment metagenome]
MTDQQLQAQFEAINAKLDHLLLENIHETHIFPSLPGTDFILTAGAVAGQWSDFGDRVVDSAGGYLRRNLPIHITSMVVEEASVVGEVYMLEI